MSKRIDFVKSIKDLAETDLRAKIQEDELRLKKLQGEPPDPRRGRGGAGRTDPDADQPQSL